jgi:hypothetical protein
MVMVDGRDSLSTNVPACRWPSRFGMRDAAAVTHTVLLRPGTNREVRIDFDPPNGLNRGAGLHRLTMPFTVDTRHTIQAGVSLRIGGEAWLGANKGDWLGRWHTDSPVVTRDRPMPYQFVLSLTDEQLAVIEQRRAGGDLQLWLDVQVDVGYDEGVTGGSLDQRWPAQEAQLAVPIQREGWVRLLSQVGAGASLAIVLPISIAPGPTGPIGEHLRGAVRKITNGEPSDGIVEARKALDVIKDLYGKIPSEQAIVSVDKEQRTLDQRLALLRHALHGLASPAAHGDASARAIRWDQTTALAAVAGIAALAATLPESPPAG